MSLEVPARVFASEEDGGDWEELTAIDDASQDGASLTVSRPVERGRILHLRMPLPKSIRQYDKDKPAYTIYALVRDVRQEGEVWRLGVRFLAKQAPPGYLERPWAVFALRSDPPPADERERRLRERSEAKPEPRPEAEGKRQFERFEIFVTFLVRQVEGVNGPPQGELGVAENISHGGARLKTNLELEPGQVVVLNDVDSEFEVRAEVKNAYVGEDGVRRANLAFLDDKSPQHLLGGS